MSVLLLLACVHLKEGAYEIDYEPVATDTCDLYDGGQPVPDTRGEVAWDDGTLVFDFDDSADTLEFEVDGPDFVRETESFYQLDSSCSVRWEQVDEGEMESNRAFVGETNLVGDLTGSCPLWEVILSTPCLVGFEWEGQYDD